MDAARFDALARSLNTTGSRRRALVSTLGGVFGTLVVAGTDAKKKKPCPPCKKRKKGKCKANLPDGTGCAGGTCQGGGCVTTPPPDCPSGQRLCRGTCLSTLICCDGNDCAGGRTCQNGTCACPAGTHLCSDQLCKQCCVKADCTSKTTTGSGVPECSASGVCVCAQQDLHFCPGDGVCGFCCTNAECSGRMTCDVFDPNGSKCKCPASTPRQCVVGSRYICTADSPVCQAECGANCTASLSCGCNGLICEKSFVDNKFYCVPPA